MRDDLDHDKRDDREQQHVEHERARCRPQCPRLRHVQSESDRQHDEGDQRDPGALLSERHVGNPLWKISDSMYLFISSMQVFFDSMSYLFDIAISEPVVSMLPAPRSPSPCAPRCPPSSCPSSPRPA